MHSFVPLMVVDCEGSAFSICFVPGSDAKSHRVFSVRDDGGFSIQLAIDGEDSQMKLESLLWWRLGRLLRDHFAPAFSTPSLKLLDSPIT